MTDLPFDEILAKLEDGQCMAESQVICVLTQVHEVLSYEPNVLELWSPITICGDIHGQLYDLLELFETVNWQASNTQRFLFMGDYVDRGYFSLETLLYLIVLKLKFPTQFYLLRGNHESRLTNAQYGFLVELEGKYGHPGIWSMCNRVFDVMPLAALIDNRVFSVHGGLSKELGRIEQIISLRRNQDLPAQGPMTDLCWGDPDESVRDWRANSRGAGYIFGAPQVDAFCRVNGDLTFITRSHQLVQEGYEWFFGRKLITVWSAPNYTYRCQNRASVMQLTPDNYANPALVTFNARAAARRKKPDTGTALERTGYFL